MTLQKKQNNKNKAKLCRTVTYSNFRNESYKWDTDSVVFIDLFIYNAAAKLYVYGTVSAKIAPRLKCYKNASRLNHYNFPTDAIDFLFSTLHTTPFHYEV